MDEVTRRNLELRRRREQARLEEEFLADHYNVMATHEYNGTDAYIDESWPRIPEHVEVDAVWFPWNHPQGEWVYDWRERYDELMNDVLAWRNRDAVENLIPSYEPRSVHDFDRLSEYSDDSQ